MTMVKSVLLSSAAAMVAVAGAQAADLPVKAKPVQYVKICTLYGDGFYYIPGSDTCIRFSGYARADYGFNNNGARTPHYTGAGGAQDRSVSRYSTRHRANLSIDTRTQTAYGTLRTFQNVSIQNDNGADTISLQRAFIQWGGFTFGRAVSYTDHEGSPGDAGFRALHQPQAVSDTGANGVNQIAYTWQLGNGFTLHVGADAQRVKSIVDLSRGAAGTGTVTVGSEPTSARHGDSHPNPYVALRVVQAWGKASTAVVANHNQAAYYTGTVAGCVQTTTTLCGHPSDVWGWAVVSGVEVKLDMLSPGSRIGGYFNYGVGATAYSGGSTLVSPGLFGSGNQIAFGVMSDAVYVNGSGLQQTTAWSTGGGFEYYWSRNFSSTLYGTYTEVSYNSTVVNNRWFCGGGGAVTQAIAVSAATACDPGFKFWTLGTHHDWFPVPGVRIALEARYTGIGTAMDGATVTLGKAQGNRPTGAYTAKDLGIWSFSFRAQRSWGTGD